MDGNSERRVVFEERERGIGELTKCIRGDEVTNMRNVSAQCQSVLT